VSATKGCQFLHDPTQKLIVNYTFLWSTESQTEHSSISGREVRNWLDRNASAQATRAFAGWLKGEPYRRVDVRLAHSAFRRPC
jgi:hypothetical protein